MAWLPIAGNVIQRVDSAGDPAVGFVLKLYAAGTTTNIPLATDSTGGTTANDAVYDANGDITVSGNPIIPHIDQDYKLVIYPSQAAADSNSGAVLTIDNIKFNAGLEGIEIGWQSEPDTGYLTIDPPSFTADTTENTHRFAILNTNAITIPAGTTALVSTLYLVEPNINATGTVTVATTAYIAGPPSEGVSNYSLFVDDGDVRLDGGLLLEGVTGVDINPGSDADADLLTVGVTGTPRLWWDESDDRFTLTHGLDIDSGALNASGGGSLTGTWSDLGTVTTVDINGGTIDGAVIGGASPADGSFTQITVDNININGAAITSDTGAISLGDDNLSTTGTMSAATGSTFGNLTLADGSITDSSGAISFGNENLSTTGTLNAGNSSLGNTALNGTLKSIQSSYTALQVGNNSTLMASKTGSDFYLAQNAYYSSTGWKRSSAAAVSVIDLVGGEITFRYAATGSADSSITWIEQAKINSSGNFLLDSTTQNSLDGVRGFVVGGNPSVGYGYEPTSGSQFLTYVASSTWNLWDSTLDLARIQVQSDGTTAFLHNGSGNSMVVGGTGSVNGITGTPSTSGTPVVMGRDTGTGRSLSLGGSLVVANTYGILNNSDSGYQGISGGSSLGSGANIILYGDSASPANDILFRTGSTSRLTWDDSDNRWETNYHWVTTADIYISSTSTGSVNSTRSKFWCNFNGTGTAAIQDSYNVASLTDVATGNYTVNLSTAFGDADWAASVTSPMFLNYIGSQAAGSVNVRTATTTPALIDQDNVSVTGHGNQ